MARPRTLADSEIFTQVLTALVDQGEKAISFGNLSRSCRLAPATLAQRFGTVDGMIHAALSAEWDRLSQALAIEAADQEKGAQGLLKRLPVPSAAVFAVSMRNADLRSRAQDWRAQVETALSLRRGGGAKGKEAAAMLFSAWYARQLLEPLGDRSFKLSDVIKRLG
jgi:AcrR family transcriptional regulator